MQTDNRRDVPTLSLEDEIQAKGLNAPRVTPAQVEAAILDELYFTAAAGVEGQLARGGVPAEAIAKALRSDSPAELLTICVLILRNGFSVIGKSAVASRANFDWDIGRRVAREDAVRQIWPLEGYLLKQKLHDAAAT